MAARPRRRPRRRADLPPQYVRLSAFAGRTGFSFDHNGLFTQLDIAPTDGLEGRKGKWTAENDHTLRISLDDKKDPDYKLEIVSVDKDVLKVRRIEQ
ncbi:hypothetical protein [Hymenobacter volaticus]|uniref:Uncharacterized protein n=1 Tax=Hymenobacter volaticus TaxID=2932254 RepID=A0ABY4G4F6_9BACT|nr:hypothetical protein [Hymenobacter volaticus]UOQ65409.1 hypothetical protein MUN86_17915 [Hymenobacter volaticus]